MYNIKEDPKFKKFLRGKTTLSEKTLKAYEFEISKFCIFLNKSFSQLVDECLNEQNDKIDFENGIIIRFNKDMGNLSDYVDEYVFYCRDIGNKEKTIQSKIKNIYAVLSYFNIITPSFPNLETNYSDWSLLDKRDIKYVLDDMSLGLKALTTFAACTGERLSDILDWKIKDHMENTFEYHKCIEIDDYMSKPFNDKTIGFYEFYPSKTKRSKIICRHGVTNECCEYIYYSIKERYAKLESLFDDGVVERKLSKNDYLFASNRNLYGKRSMQGIQNSYNTYNSKLKNHHISIYNQELSSGKISKETYDMKINTIPKFNAHSLRKWFISTVRANCSNLSICVQMEGHALPITTDNSYVKFDKETIKEEYFKMMPLLSFNNTEVKVLTSEKIKYYENELENQRKINRQYNEKFKRLEKLETFIKNLDNFDFDKI